MDTNERITKLEAEVKILREILKEVALCFQELAREYALANIKIAKEKIENLIEVKR